MTPAQVRTRVRDALLVAALAALLASAAPAVADPAPEAGGSGGAWHTELWNGMMSPYCPGRTLIDCPSGQAQELREWIAAQDAAGRPRAEVEEELYQQYGDVILQAPKARGFGLAAYAIPLVAFAAGGALVWLFLRRQGQRVAAAPMAAPRAIDPEVERQIDEELART